MTPTRILGIDPGINITGYGILESSETNPRLIEAGVIRTKRSGTLGSRLVELHAGLRDLLAQFSPSALAIEQVYSHYERPQTAILMAHARGVLCLTAANAGLPIHDYAATQIKKILTGNGRAPKEQMQWAVCREFGMRELPDPPDVADALAVALCHFHLFRTQSVLP